MPDPILAAEMAPAAQMLRASGARRGVAHGTVVHFVGRMTDQVFGFLGPATAALAQSGIEQTVILVDELQYRHLLPRFHTSVAVVLTPAEPRAWRRWGHSRRALGQALAQGSVKAVHLHGLFACLVGLPVLRSSSSDVLVYYSPHGSRSLGALSRLVGWVVWLLRRTSHGAWRPPIVNVTTESHYLSPMSTRTPQLVESAVDPAFFDVERNEARHPLVVTGHRSHSPRSVELFAQLAVLLGADELRIGFNWLGVVDALSLQSLNSAGVGVFDLAGPADRAARLAASWVYVALGETRGFPLFLVEAMAAGLPCVAVDTAYHRDIIRHGETGFLCRSEADLVRCIARLVDLPELRSQIGLAARREAEARFSQRRFQDSLFAAYELDGPEAAAVLPHAIADTGERAVPARQRIRHTAS